MYPTSDLLLHPGFSACPSHLLGILDSPNTSHLQRSNPLSAELLELPLQQQDLLGLELLLDVCHLRPRRKAGELTWGWLEEGVEPCGLKKPIYYIICLSEIIVS